MIIFYKVMLVPELLYGIEIVTTIKKAEQRLQSSEMKLSRLVAN